MEQWKPVVGLEGIYEVSNIGRIKSLSRKINNGNTGFFSKEKINLGTLSKEGYNKFKLSRNMYTVHRLVAKAFIPNPQNLPCACHKDETLDKNGSLYNGADNLYWGTHSDNMKDKFKKGRSNSHFLNNHPHKGKFGKDNHNSKKAYQYTKEGIFIKEWDSLMDIQRELGIHVGSISACCRGKIKSAGGFIWKYT